MADVGKTITLTYSQAWSIASSIGVAVFVLTMIYASFIDVRSTQEAGMKLFEEFKIVLEEELEEEKAHQNFLYKETNRRLDTKTVRIEKDVNELDERVKILESE